MVNSNDIFDSKLNSIYTRITNEDFLNSGGIGNEVPYYIFAYSPLNEVKVNQHLKILTEQIYTSHSKMKLLEINLFKEVIDLLRENNIYDDVLEMQQNKARSQEVLYALSGTVDETHIARKINDKYKLSDNSLILMYGVGSSHPLVCVSKMLSNLQAYTGKTPMVIFYPGKFGEKSFSLFDLIQRENYYRAFSF